MGRLNQFHDWERWFASCTFADANCLDDKVERGRYQKMGDGLSKRESEVLSWLQRGISNKEIAIALGISPRTIQKHLQRIYLQLDVHTRAEAIVRMRRGSRDVH